MHIFMENDRTEISKENAGMKTSCTFHNVKTLSRKAKFNNRQSPALITHFLLPSQVQINYTFLITTLSTPLQFAIMLRPCSIF